MTPIVNSIKSQIQNSFKGYDKKTNTEYKTVVKFDQNEKNFSMEFADKLRYIRKDGMPTVDGQNSGHADKIGDVKNNSAQVRIDSQGKVPEVTNDVDQIVRTGAHEYGHMAGLKHPSGDPRTDNDAVTNIEESPNNLMRQSPNVEGEGATEITISQFEKILSIIEEQGNIIE